MQNGDILTRSLVWEVVLSHTDSSVAASALSKDNVKHKVKHTLLPAFLGGRLYQLDGFARLGAHPRAEEEDGASMM